ncbi:MAG: HD domain-containing protein [Proteobacteria bacterium]|nr:HD domain-containing protein [Pseudomonadota bacterium]
MIEFDAYIKINEEKYLKLHQSGDVLDPDDCSRIEVKFLNNLFLQREDAFIVVRNFEEFLSSKILNAPEPIPKTIGINEALQSVAMLCKSFGWSAESVQLAKKMVDARLKIIQRNKSWQQLVIRPMGDDGYGLHMSQLALITSLVAHNIGWHSESTQEKLIMASLLHDHFVDESVYDSLDAWKQENEKHHPGGSKTQYFQHPILAAELARKIKGLPVNVDTIIAEHHERPLGNGFPRSLGASRISALSGLFIICESLVMYAFSQEGKVPSLEGFLAEYPDYATKEPFKKIVNLLRFSSPA